jgi:hypothetical protein
VGIVNIKVDVKLNNLRALQSRITKFNLSEDLANTFAKRLKTTIKQRSPNSTGELYRSIKSRKVGRYGSGVYAAYYFWAANDGRSAGKMPPADHPRLTVWAKKQGFDENDLRVHIGKRGTEGKNYYETAMIILQKVDKPRAYRKITKGKF